MFGTRSNDLRHIDFSPAFTKFHKLWIQKNGCISISSLYKRNGSSKTLHSEINNCVISEGIETYVWYMIEQCDISLPW